MSYVFPEAVITDVIDYFSSMGLIDTSVSNRIVNGRDRVEKRFFLTGVGKDVLLGIRKENPSYFPVKMNKYM